MYGVIYGGLLVDNWRGQSRAAEVEVYLAVLWQCRSNHEFKCVMLVPMVAYTS